LTVLAVYGSAAAVCAVSALIGQAVMSACGRRGWSGLAPAVGLAVLLTITAVTARLPGRATTALGVILLLTVACAVYLRGRVTGTGAALRVGLPVVLLAALAVSVPFAASGRVGVLGTVVLSDFSEQQFIAEWLRTEFGEAPRKIALGYPLGPNGLAGALSAAGAGPVRATFTGLMLAVPVLTALAALSALGRLPGWRRTIASTLVGVTYLGVAYMVHSSFKETIFALILLAFALMLAEARAASQPGAPPRSSAGVPLGLLAAGAVATFSLPALAWLVAIVACWLLAEGIALRRASSDERAAALRGVLGPLRLGLAVTLIAIAPQVVGASGFIASDTAQVTTREGLLPGDPGTGSLYRPLPVYEAFGLWPSPDFRFAPGGALGEPLSALVGCVAVAFGLAWWARRRELAIPAALIACLAIFAVASQVSIPFFAAKALALTAPLAMLVALGALLAPGHATTTARTGYRAAKALLAVAFVAGSAYSSYLALQGAQVDTEEHHGELESFRPLVEGQTVLYLLGNVFPGYALDIGRPVESVGGPVDFDELRPQFLNQIDFVITTRTAYQSAAPRSYSRVRATRSFALWRRRDPVESRLNLDQPGAPGAILTCDATDRRLLDRPGSLAAIFPVPPRARDASAWLPVPGPDGRAFQQRLRLPPGRWQISLQYFSQAPLRVRAPGLDVSLPALTGQIAPFWPVATVDSKGRPIEITVSRGARSPLAGVVGRRFGPGIPEWLLGDLAAVRPGPRRTLPLRAACGRYVDWYRLDPSGVRR
jgi:hypothetical protein